MMQDVAAAWGGPSEVFIDRVGAAVEEAVARGSLAALIHAGHGLVVRPSPGDTGLGPMLRAAGFYYLPARNRERGQVQLPVWLYLPVAGGTA